MKAFGIQSLKTHPGVLACYCGKSASEAKSKAASTLIELGFSRRDVYSGLRAKRLYEFDPWAECCIGQGYEDFAKRVGL